MNRSLLYVLDFLLLLVLRRGYLIDINNNGRTCHTLEVWSLYRVTTSYTANQFDCCGSKGKTHSTNKLHTDTPVASPTTNSSPIIAAAT